MTPFGLDGHALTRSDGTVFLCQLPPGHSGNHTHFPSGLSWADGETGLWTSPTLVTGNAVHATLTYTDQVTAVAT